MAVPLKWDSKNYKTIKSWEIEKIFFFSFLLSSLRYNHCLALMYVLTGTVSQVRNVALGCLTLVYTYPLIIYLLGGGDGGGMDWGSYNDH